MSHAAPFQVIPSLSQERKQVETEPKLLGWQSKALTIHWQWTVNYQKQLQSF